MKQSDSLSRREFLSTTGKLSAGLMAAGALSSCGGSSRVPAAGAAAKRFGPNAQIQMAVVGVRSRGWHLVSEFAKMPGVRIAALCDIDGNVLSRRAAEFEQQFGYRPKTYGNYRELLEDPAVDAVVLATPNHWHALGTVWACQAGKHVYVEKPCCHNVFEGRKMVEAARKYDRLVQVGLQNRSIGNVRKAMEFLHGGGIGKVYMARGLCYKPRDWIGQVKDGIGTGPEYEYYVFNQPGKHYDQAYLDKVDYEQWTGPAPLLPFNYNRFHYNWHWNRLYGGGDAANQGPHQFDIARWGLGQREHPVKISGFGGIYGPPSDQDVPDTLTANLEYGDGTLLVFEVRGWYTNAEDEIQMGNLFLGTEGWMRIDGSQWQTYFGRNNEPGPGSEADEASADPMIATGAGDEGHFANFVQALRTGRRSDLTAEIEEGYLSSALPALANISQRLGRTLTFDGEREQFVGDGEANRLLTRKYRRPYVVPERV